MRRRGSLVVMVLVLTGCGALVPRPVPVVPTTAPRYPVQSPSLVLP